MIFASNKWYDSLQQTHPNLRFILFLGIIIPVAFSQYISEFLMFGLLLSLIVYRFSWFIFGNYK